MIEQAKYDKLQVEYFEQKQARKDWASRAEQLRAELSALRQGIEAEVERLRKKVERLDKHRQRRPEVGGLLGALASEAEQEANRLAELLSDGEKG